jgi:hypothetical protein
MNDTVDRIVELAEWLSKAFEEAAADSAYVGGGTDDVLLDGIFNLEQVARAIEAEVISPRVEVLEKALEECDRVIGWSLKHTGECWGDYPKVVEHAQFAQEQTRAALQAGGE